MKKNDEFYLISEVRVKTMNLKSREALNKTEKEVEELRSNGWLVSSKKDKNFITYFCYHKSELNDVIKEGNVSKLKQIDAIVQGIYESNKKARNLKSLSDKECAEITKGTGIYGVTQKYGETRIFKAKMFTSEEYDKFLNSEGLISAMVELWKEGVSVYHRFKRLARIEYELMNLLSAQNRDDEAYVKGALKVLVPLYRDDYDLYRRLAEDISKLYYETHPKKKSETKGDESQIKFRKKLYGNKGEQMNINDVVSRGR